MELKVRFKQQQTMMTRCLHAPHRKAISHYIYEYSLEKDRVLCRLILFMVSKKGSDPTPVIGRGGGSLVVKTIWF